MGMLRTKIALAILGAASVLLVTHSSDAAGEQFYMMFNCQNEDPSVTQWGLNQYGYFNTNALDGAFLFCQQPHVVGNNGHNGGSAVVYDRHSTLGVDVELCRNDGTGDELCDLQSSTGTGGPITLNFSSNSDSSRSYYYWRISIPPYSTQSSHLTSLFFKDN